jgi:hypothetical protein
VERRCAAAAAAAFTDYVSETASRTYSTVSPLSYSTYSTVSPLTRTVERRCAAAAASTDYFSETASLVCFGRTQQSLCLHGLQAGASLRGVARAVTVVERCRFHGVFPVPRESRLGTRAAAESTSHKGSRRWSAGARKSSLPPSLPFPLSLSRIVSSSPRQQTSLVCCPFHTFHTYEMGGRRVDGSQRQQAVERRCAAAASTDYFFETASRTYSTVSPLSYSTYSTVSPYSTYSTVTRIISPRQPLSSASDVLRRTRSRRESAGRGPSPHAQPVRLPLLGSAGPVKASGSWSRVHGYHGPRAPGRLRLADESCQEAEIWRWREGLRRALTPTRRALARRPCTFLGC